MSNQKPFLTPAVGHVKARTETPKGYPPRGDIPQSKTPWSVPFPDYKPTAYTAQAVLDNDRTKQAGGWADPPSIDRNLLRAAENARAARRRVNDAAGRWAGPEPR